MTHHVVFHVLVELGEELFWSHAEHDLTIADLEGSEAVRRAHVAEALIYRRVAPAGAPLIAG